MSSPTRRRVLGQVAAVSALPLMMGSAAASVAKPDGRVFSLGVASGEPVPDGIVIWTRLARDPLNGGGMPNEPLKVRWEVSADENMTRIVRSGVTLARPELAHAIHVPVQGLEPHRWYWYRFQALGETSTVGRTRTAAAAGLDRFRFAFASCQHYEMGFYTAYEHMAREDLDLVVHLGDYIYEYARKLGRPRQHDLFEATTLDAYRNRYALYKLDPALQAAHAAFPWLVTWDDHEVQNNYANDRDRHGETSPKMFRQRRAAAYRAYYEHMPLRPTARPRGPDMQLYRRYGFGNLLTMHMLDSRQYRTDQPCGDKKQPLCDGALAPNATMLGFAQERWLQDGLSRDQAVWSILGQQVPMMERAIHRRGEVVFDMDKWDGYVAARDRLLGHVADVGKRNLIVLSGDVHAAWVGDLRRDFKKPNSPVLGTEFVCTSISSKGDGWDSKKKHRRTVAINPHLKFYNGRRGYTRCDVSPGHWRADYRTVLYISRPGAPVSTAASFVVDRAKPGVETA
jgi:alkaline phosphatase D